MMKLSGLFSDHAVLQQGMPIPVWGWSTPCARIRAELGPVSAEYFAGVDGNFLLRLPAMPAGGPYELTVCNQKSGERIVLRDIWVGEVWLASGQSNMEWSLEAIGGAGPGDAKKSLSTLRMLTVPHHADAGRRSDLVSRPEQGGVASGCRELPPVWRCSGEPGTGTFSATAYYFGLELQAKLGTAVGIIHSSWGGTIVESWTSRETLVRNPEMAESVARYERETSSPEFWRAYPENEVDGMPRFPAGNFPADPGNEGEAKGWHRTDCDFAAWPEMTLPGAWTGRGHEYSGIFWFRKTIDLPDELAGKDLVLGIGAVDKQDITYFNGVRVGATGFGFQAGYWDRPREYPVPGELVRAGENVIAVRAYSFAYAGGMIGPESEMYLRSADGHVIGLGGEWRYRVEVNFGKVTITPQLPSLPGPGNANSPHMLFDNMIAPLIPYGIRGVIWYQGESDACNADGYHRKLVDMIRDWRFRWGQGDFPFLQVQLANFDAPDSEDWPTIREAQLRALSEPAVGMVVAVDVGEKNNIHPSDKHTVGHRLSLWALATAYGAGRNSVFSGPLYREMEIEGGRIRISFDHTDGGLVAKGGRLRGFSIADATGHFVPAEAKIEAESFVMVSAPEITDPTAVRYGWSNNPECNLYNRTGLPASPFRTDFFG